MESLISIAIAEDHEIVRKGVIEIITAFGGYSIDIEAGNGQELFEKLSVAERLPDIVVMDISMPVLDGVGATAQIRELGVDTPIVAMTANAMKDDVASYLAQGMNDYVPKPVDRKVLLKVFLRWLK